MPDWSEVRAMTKTEYHSNWESEYFINSVFRVSLARTYIAFSNFVGIFQARVDVQIGRRRFIQFGKFALCFTGKYKITLNLLISGENDIITSNLLRTGGPSSRIQL